MEELLLVTLMLIYTVYVLFIHVAHTHEWAFTHVYTHTATRGWPVDLIPSLAACAWFHPPLPFLPAAVAVQLPAAAGKGTKTAFVVSFQLHYHESYPATVGGTLGLTCPPVQMLMNWDIVFFFLSFAFSAACVRSLNVFKKLLSLSFFQLIFFVSWNSGHTLLLDRMQLKLFITFVG